MSVQEIHRQDEVEVEEEEDSSSSAQKKKDASTRQVNVLKTWARREFFPHRLTSLVVCRGRGAVCCACSGRRFQGTCPFTSRHQFLLSQGIVRGARARFLWGRSFEKKYISQKMTARLGEATGPFRPAFFARRDVNGVFCVWIGERSVRLGREFYQYKKCVQNMISSKKQVYRLFVLKYNINTYYPPPPPLLLLCSYRTHFTTFT